MLQVEIDRAKWLHGEGPRESYLIRESDGKQCCLGFACEALGIERKELVGVRTPQSLDKPQIPHEWRTYHNEGDGWAHVFNDSLLLLELMTGNDFPANADVQEKTIIEYGKRVGIAFTFTGSYGT